MTDQTPKSHPVPFGFEDRNFRQVGLAWSVMDNAGNTQDFRSLGELERMLAKNAVGEAAAVSHDGEHWTALSEIDDLPQFFWEHWQRGEAVGNDFGEGDISVASMPRPTEDLWEDITMPSALIKKEVRALAATTDVDEEVTAVRPAPDPAAFDDEDPTVTRLSSGPPPGFGDSESLTQTETVPPMPPGQPSMRRQLYTGLALGLVLGAAGVGLPMLMWQQGLIGARPEAPPVRPPVVAPADRTSQPEPVVVSTPEPAVVPAPSTEKLTTRDGVEIVADVYPAEAGASGVVLLHMIPPQWERSSWPESFITSLRGRGWSVCVPDRRGAGESSGVAEDAYKGNKGRYDVEVCVKRLQADGLGKLAVIGASNGTTSMVDYAVWAESEGLPAPVMLGFMTGGSYTENNTRVDAVADIPAIFTFSTEEREWSAAQEGKSPVWNFREFQYGEHGTKMFESQPDVGGDLVAALAKAL